MRSKKMSQKKFEGRFKKKAKEFAQNMCIFCKHNSDCKLPLHGKYRKGGDVCANAEHPDLEQYTALVVEHFYGVDVKEAFMAKLYGMKCNDEY